MSKTFRLPERIGEGTLLLFLKISGTLELYETGASRCFIKNLLPDNSEIFHRETLCVSESLWYRKILLERFFGVCEYLSGLGIALLECFKILCQ